MKRILKWIGVVVGGLVAVIVVAALVLYFIGGSRLDETYNIEVRAVSVPA